jgi:hypothetical protein
MSIEQLEEIADSVAEELDAHMEIIGKFALNIKKSKFPSTNFALFGFIPKVESIRISIFELAKIGEVYSEKILFRSFCEHFLKFQYIFMRFVHDKTDDVGKEYFIFCGAQEELNFARSLKNRAGVLEKNIEMDPLILLKEYQPILENESNKSINKIADQFKHRNIVDYISKNINVGKEIPNLFLPNILPLYSELSSFVHGGPSSQRNSEICSNAQLAEESLVHDANMCLQMSLAVRYFAFLIFAQENEKMFSPFKVVSDSLKSLGKSNQKEA